MLHTAREGGGGGEVEMSARRLVYVTPDRSKIYLLGKGGRKTSPLELHEMVFLGWPSTHTSLLPSP